MPTCMHIPALLHQLSPCTILVPFRAPHISASCIAMIDELLSKHREMVEPNATVMQVNV